MFNKNGFVRNLKETFGINNVIVALPVSEDSITEVNVIDSSEISFVYPALSRFFKNFEVICEACQNWK